jgi:hypothetical protein
MTLKISAMFALTLTVLPAHAYGTEEAKTPPTSRELKCAQSERQWVNRLVQLRDKGVPKEELLASVAQISKTDESRSTNLSRVNDVYLDSHLSEFTLAVYRVAKCLDGHASEDWALYQRTVSSELLVCQAKGDGTAPSLSPCIVDLIDSVREEKARSPQLDR